MKSSWKTMVGMAGVVALAGAMLMPMPASRAADSKEETYMRNTLVCLKLLFTDLKAHDELCPGELTVTPRSLEYGAGGGGAPCVITLGGISGPFNASDPCVKHQVMFLMEQGGLRFYSFKYIGDDQVFYGVMADELMADPRFAPYVHLMAGGYYGVDYEGLGLTVPDNDAMHAAGERAMQIVAALHQG